MEKGLEERTEFRPLEGVRVVELSHLVLGPSCGMFLAFLGAEVIKVEPVAGDRTRDLTGMGASFFPLFNRGKKSVVLDLARSEGRVAMDSLLGSADVFVENFRDGSLAEKGLDPDRLRKRFPHLVTVACKGFLHGPHAHRPALDETVQMMTGLAYMTGPAGRPLRIGSSANDIMAGLFGATSAMAALREREVTGRGREIRVGLFENSLMLVAQHMVQFALTGREPAPMPEREFTWPVYDIFATKDGRDLFVGAVTGGQWETLCTLLGLESLLDDPRLAGRMDRIRARHWTIPVFGDAIAEHAASELMARFEAEGIPYSPVSRPGEMYDHPQAAAGLPDSALPDGRSFRAPGLPVEIDGARIVPDLDVPALGGDTAEVLEGLGFDTGFVERATSAP